MAAQCVGDSTKPLEAALDRDVPYFSDYKMHFSHKIWEGNGGVSYSPNVAYLAHWGVGVVVVELSLIHI